MRETDVAKIEFMITRDGTLLADGQLIDRYLSQAAAADMAVRFAQDQAALYSILYA
jgi:hypothetical protein